VSGSFFSAESPIPLVRWYKQLMRPKLPPILALLSVIAAMIGAPGSSSSATTLGFVNYTPGSISSGEPSIGVSWKTGAVMYVNGTDVYRVTGFNPSTRRSTWTKVTPRNSLTGLDPILFTDPITSRTFASQLIGACSLMSYTDDDGANWTPSPLGCGIGTVADHQTVGGGPFAAPLTGGTALYPNAVYYCAQGLVVATCALSVNGGLSFGPATVMANAKQCSGPHGHIVVSPVDGTAYVPYGSCSRSQPSLFTSSDNGTTWTVSHPDDIDTSNGLSDPAVAVGAKGTVYYGWPRASIHSTGPWSEPYVAVSRDKGAHWTRKNVAPQLGLRNIEFSTMIAGDDERAAFAFLGTTTPGNTQSPAFRGIWHLYVSVTTDRGATWTTTNVTPSDPVQRGTICLLGLNCDTGRNLLDFMGMAIDKYGKIYVAYPDGCVALCVTDARQPSRSARATIARQAVGPDLIAAR
jgi:hypothetical protein